MNSRPKFAWKHKQANLPNAAYEENPSFDGIGYYMSKASDVKKDWCRTCAHEIVNEKVIEFSLQKYGEVKCWNCQQKQNE